MFEGLDHDLISEAPAPLFMGELPRHWEEIPAPVVINLCGVYPAGEPYGRVVHGLAMLDVLDASMMPSRERLEAFLDAVHVHAASTPSYWHCHAGLNRSGLAVAAYLHRHRGLRISEAIATLRERRTRLCLCNSLFERTLRSWYGGSDEQEFEPVPIDAYLVQRHGRRPPR